MAVRIQSGFEFGVKPTAARMLVTEATGPLSFQIVCNSSGVQHATSANGSVTVVDADTKWAHEDMQTVMGTGKFDDFPGTLKAALDAGSVANGNSWTYTVSYSTSTLKYTISAAEGNIALAFTSITGDDGSNTQGTAMRQLLGYNGDQSSGASHTSERVPYYAISAASDGKSRVRDDYEPGGIVVGDYAMGGSDYSVDAPTATLFHDWTQMFESKAKTYKRDAATATPWTYQHMWEHVRGTFPFLVVDDNESTVHRLRPDSASFSPDRETADSDQYWHLPFGTYMLGRL